MGMLTCQTCKRILDENEFRMKDPQVGRRSLHCKQCDNIRQQEYRAQKDGVRGNWLMFGCVHLPFEHPDALHWLVSLDKKYGFKRKFMMGDLYDWGGLNRFQHNPNMPSPIEEYSRTIEVRSKWFAAFPEVDMIYGNHDLRPMARAGEAYLPEILLRDLREVMGLPEGWRSHGSRLVVKHHTLGEVLMIHGDKVNKDALTNAKACGKHVVMADRHTMCKAAWVETVLGEKRFGINTGCIIDADREAFAYSKGRMSRPLIAVGAIIDGNPMNLVMHVDEHNRWIDR